MCAALDEIVLSRYTEILIFLDVKMNTLFTIVVVIQVLAALSIIGLVLMQHGKGADMGAAFASFWCHFFVPEREMTMSNTLCLLVLCSCCSPDAVFERH